MDRLDAYYFHEESWESYEELYEAFEWEVPGTLNAADYICDRWVEGGDRPAIYSENAAGKEAVYSFRDLQGSANRLANFLAARGTGRGDRVGLNLPQKPETVIGHVACWKLGAVSVPLSTLFGPDGLSYRLDDAGAEACKSTSRTSRSCAMHGTGGPVWRRCSPSATLTPETTSATSGRPSRTVPPCSTMSTPPRRTT